MSIITNQTITSSHSDQTANTIQPYQYPNTELVALKEVHLAEKEAALLLLQRENVETTTQVQEIKNLFIQVVAQQNTEKAFLEQRIRGLESELTQVKISHAILIEEKDRKNEVLQDIIVSLDKIVQDLKKRDWTKENTHPDTSGLTPTTRYHIVSAWEQKKSGYFGKVPTTPWMREVLVAIENAKAAIDQENIVQLNPAIPRSNSISIPLAKK